MKEILIKTWFLMLAIALLVLKAIALLILAPFILCIKLYELISYEAQCLRHPPPPGGMCGAMVRAQRERERQNLKPDSSDSSNPSDQSD